MNEQVSNALYHLAFLLVLIQIFNQFSKDVLYQILRDNLSLPGVVIQLIENVDEGLILGEPTRKEKLKQV